MYVHECPTGLLILKLCKSERSENRNQVTNIRHQLNFVVIIKWATKKQKKRQQIRQCGGFVITRWPSMSSDVNGKWQ